MYKIDQKAVVWKKVESEVVILNLNTGHYYTLNEAGLVLWTGILDKLSIEMIAQKLVEAFEVEYKTALKDIRACIEQLIQEGIVAESLVPPAKKK